jgi:hypothetical protein
MSIEELISPERVALDDEALQIYNAMCASEVAFVNTLKERFSARVWRQHVNDDADGVEFSEDLELAGGKRRFIALVPERHCDALRAAWPHLLSQLQAPRAQMLAIVRALAIEQSVNRPGAGLQSTSMPLLIAGVCSRVTYTVNVAFRGTVTAQDIDAFLLRREQQLLQSIDVATQARQRARVANYERRLDDLRADAAVFELLKTQHNQLVGRVMSGNGSRVCFWRGAGDSTQQTLQHIAVAVAHEDCEVKRASRRMRESKYGELLATLAGSLLVYAA